tara:strand:- start:3359 stop:9781 length:6423 start_codon:yes stop_codon:yes gene_type:complete
MAKQQNTSSTETNAFSGGMQKDTFPSLNKKEVWGHAVNAANNSVDGDIGVIGNEPANLLCAIVPYTIIGSIKTYGDQWVIYSTDDINSEIGIFDDSECKYETLVNDPCLSFNRKYLITGAAKENYDCTWQVYWDDSNNPSRTLNLDNVPYKQIITSAPGADCVIYEDTTELNCEQLRLAPLLDTPCVKLSKNEDGGQLRNGSYQAYVAYVLNGQKVTDYIGVSNLQALFDHRNNGGSLIIDITNLDQDFEEYEVVIFSDNQGAKVGTKLGVYSTEQSRISVDFIDPALPAVQLSLLFLRSPAYERSESMYVVNDYLIRQGPTEQFDFNYQPLANQIQAKWVVAEYPSGYYFEGGNKTQFMRDEVYPFFIRWIYNTGEKSASYHIPGRAPDLAAENQFGQPAPDLGTTSGTNVISASGQEYNFQVYNTATSGPPLVAGLTTDDGGVIIAKGGMAYWQSTERYPATKPDIWGDLCGKEIRHHKMPSEEIAPALALSSGNGAKIRLLGVEFNNITAPVYNDGTIIPNIVGYEILRGSREGNKSILAKGIFRNMREYDIPNNDGNLGPSKGLYPNFPYNDLRSDTYHWDGVGTPGGNLNWDIWEIDPMPKTSGCMSDYSDTLSDFAPITGYRKDVFTFHSPELMFRRPFLNPYEVRIYGAVSGESVGNFKVSEKHPQNKLLRNGAAIVAGIVGIGYAIGQMQGSQKVTTRDANNLNAPWQPIFIGPVGTNAPGFNVAAYPTSLGVGLGTVAGNVAINVLLDETSKIFDVTAMGGSINDLLLPIIGGVQQGIGAATPGMSGGGFDREYVKDTEHSALSFIYKLVLNVTGSRTHIAIGAQKIIDLLYNLVSAEDFAYKYNSHGLFDSYDKTQAGQIYRTRNIESNYIGSTFQTFNTDFKVNNLFRPDTVVIQTSSELDEPQVFGAPVDKSRFTLGGDADGGSGNQFIKNPDINQTKDISVLYGALKFNFENQYGQLEGIKQVVMPTCVYPIDTTDDKPDRTYTTAPIFSGDTYVDRYTEKVIMPIFTDFLYGQPDQFPYNYLQRINIPYPRFWMNTRKYDTTELAKKLTTIIGSGASDAMPNDLFYLDRGSGSCVTGIGQIFDNKGGNPAFAMRYGYMYTHCNGVVDFFTESEVNLPFRDWEDTPEGRYYDPHRYEETAELFHAEIQKRDNNYTYDYSLSASRFATNLTKGGVIQPRDYNPEIAETCFTNYPKRLIYSLQAQEESKKDFWRVFLPNNYKDFKDRVNIIKPTNKSGAVIFFPYQSPQMFQGLDQLQTDLGTKLTIGDGGLFSQPFQNLVNSDLSNEYGSCESQRGVMNTPFGFFFISQAQGKVFQQNGQGLQPISNSGMKWWFNKYLPSNLISQYPALEFSKLADNPVIGVGCQVAYDISDDIVYFCKRDYSVRDEYLNSVSYDAEADCFTFSGKLPPLNPITDYKDPLVPPVYQKPKSKTAQLGQTTIGEGIGEVDQNIIGVAEPLIPITNTRCIEIGDPQYFNDCSWTVSYDPKSQAWISFHDWHPELNLSSINHFLTTQSGTTDIPQCPEGYVYNAITRDCERLIDQTEPARVTVIDTPIGIQTECPEGFTYNEKTGVCESFTIFPVSCGEEIKVNKAQQIEAYGDFGTRFYESATGRPLPISSVSSSSPFRLDDALGNELLIDNYLPDPCGSWSSSCDLWRNRLNTVGVWTSAGSSPQPNGEWIGFTVCIQVEVQKEYCVGIAADNRTRFSVNGDLTVQLNNSDTNNFKYWHVIPLTLNPGTNIITLEGYNDGSYASFGAEIYDADAATLATITDDATLASVTLYSSREATLGGVFELGTTIGCSCPNGGTLTNCGGQLQCIEIETVPLGGECECESVGGGTLVYYDPIARNFTNPDGDCFDGDIPPPICRTVTCLCPPGPDPDAIVIQSGDCDDVYQAGPNGNPNYINPNPRMCTYNLLESTEPNFDIGGIWRHNYRCDLFANYYGIDYPWEVELVEHTGQNVMTIRSLEYQLESYVYKGDQFNACGDDRWHDLDFNFDESIIYNSEQVSGLLRLELEPKEDPLNALTYPIINSNDIQILYSKVEQKFRFNQFWDVTDDRGEFTNAERNILITECNGYIRNLNSVNLNYNKAEDQRKKFRHYYNKILLRRNLSNNRKMLLKLVNSKLNLSFR